MIHIRSAVQSRLTDFCVTPQAEKRERLAPHSRDCIGENPRAVSAQHARPRESLEHTLLRHFGASELIPRKVRRTMLARLAHRTKTPRSHNADNARAAVLRQPFDRQDSLRDMTLGSGSRTARDTLRDTVARPASAGNFVMSAKAGHSLSDQIEPACTC